MLRRAFAIIFIFAVFANFALCANSPFVSAEGSIEVSYPEKVDVDSQFDFKIKLVGFQEGVYDVKIDILSGEKRIAKILNGEEWKSCYYYLSQAISSNEEKSFSMKIAEASEKADITIKIRSASGSISTFANYTIKTQDGEDIPSAEENEIESSINTEEEKKENIEVENKVETTTETKAQIEEVPTPIILNAKDIKTTITEENSGKNKYAIYGLLSFCILLGILFFIKKKRYKNEFDKE